MLWQSFKYSSFSNDPNELAKVSILEEVRREHWLRFRDLSAGTEETSAPNPTSERRHAPLRDKETKEGKQLADRAKVEFNI